MMVQDRTSSPEDHARTKSPLARQMLEKIGEIFAIERDINGQDAAVRLTARQSRSVPLLISLKAFYDASLDRISGKSDLAKAIRYSTSRWQALTRFTDDGRLEMSNNAA